MQAQQALRQSFQQLVVNHQVQRPAANRCYGRRSYRQRTQSGFTNPVPPFSMPPGASTDWTLNAVRQSQTTESVGTASGQLILDITRKVNEQHAAILKRHLEIVTGVVENESQLRGKVKASIVELQNGLLERETEVRLMLLAALCGEHLLLLGPPGTAKSELSRRLSKLTGGRYFERLLTCLSMPEELFGTPSMKSLENEDVHEIDGYLSTAEVAFVDEIFRANSTMLNSLLMLLSERHIDNGSVHLEVPLLCLVGASNELPESEELDALYDRFLFRRQVAQVSAAQLVTLARLAAGQTGGAMRSTEQSSSSSSNSLAAVAGLDKLTIQDIRSTAEEAYRSVEVPDPVIGILIGVRNYLQEQCKPPVYVSDRRFMKAVRMLQVAAYADGRAQVNVYDSLLLEFVLGQRPGDSQRVKSYVLEAIGSDSGLKQVEVVFLGLFARSCRILETPSYPELAQARAEAASMVELLGLHASALAATLPGDQAGTGGFPELRSTLWQSDAAAQAVMKALTPQMMKNKKRVEELLKETMLLQAALDRGLAASQLGKLLPNSYRQYQMGRLGMM